MFKKIKSLFIIEDETGSEGNADQRSAAETSGGESGAAPTEDIKFEKPVFDEDNPPKGKLNEKFVDRLLKAIEENNMEGFDYLEYKQALQNLKTVEMDEETKFKSALAVAQTMGANKAKLVESAEHYLKVLKTEESKFVEAFKNQLSKQVTAKSNAVTAIEQRIEKKKQEIERLKKEIEADSKELEKSKSSIDEAKAKVEATKDGFYHAYHIVNEQIKDDLEKIKQFLQ